MRLIARLDIKGPNVVKGVRMEGLRVMGDPITMATKYASEADEIIYIDTVSSLYGRPQLTTLLERTTDSVFVPVTVAGGIRTRDDVQRLLDAGADKVAINSAAVRNPNLIQDIANRYGSQAIVVSIEACRRSKPGEPPQWEAVTDNGREKSGLDAVVWAREAVSRGAGEILVTSVDRDGTRSGFETEIIEEIADLPVPVVASGGMGEVGHLVDVIKAGADAVAIASVLHYGKFTIGGLRERLIAEIDVRGQGKRETRGTEGRPESGIQAQGA